jgi:Tol biopolymer transport system component/DNA-binding winged helix-turn-helix (wHTH) protein
LEGGLQSEDLKAGFWVGDWLVEPSINRMSRDKDDVAVEPRVMDVLVCLAEQPGRTVTKDYFFETVWEGMVVTEDVLSRCISELRKNLGDDSRDPTYIETIRKTGYRLLAPVSVREPGAVPDQRRRQPNRQKDRAADSAPEQVTAPTRSAGESLPTGRRKQIGVVIALIALAGLYAVYAKLVAPVDEAPATPVTTPFTTLPGLEIDPAFSPDGRMIAFASDDNGNRNFDIFIKQEGSDKALRLTEDEADERFPAWSPDGLFLAFTRSGDETNSVHTIPSLGGQERKIADFGPRRVQGVSWSPDESLLAVSAQREPFGAFSIYLVDVDSTLIRRITTPDRSDQGDVRPVFSPDGKAVAFTRGVDDDVQDIFVYFFETNEARQVTHDSASVAGLDWLPDAASLVFASNRNHASGIWRIGISGGEPEPVAAAGTGAIYEHPSVSWDGRRLAYVQRNANVNIWRLFKPEGFPSLRARPAIFSTHWDSNPDIAPDGSRIAFASTQSGHREIWLADPDGENPAQLTSVHGRARNPKWSPDGNELAFEWREKGQADVYVVPSEGGAARRLTRSPYEDTVPVWSRDGASIYFSSNRSGAWEIWRIPSAGGSPEQVTSGGGRYGMEAENGRSLYYVRPDTQGIWNLSLESETEPHLVYGSLDHRDWANWAVTTSGIYFVQRETYAPALSFFGFQSRRTTRIKTLDDVPAHPALDVSSDGSWFAYTQIDDEGSDVVVMENF